MIALVLATCAASGVHLVWTSWSYGWRTIGAGSARGSRGGHDSGRDGGQVSGDVHGGGDGPMAVPTRLARVRGWLIQAGLDDTQPVEFLVVAVTMALIGGAVAFALFGSALPALVAAGFAGTLPVATYRSRRRRRSEKAQEAWPHLIEEIRILTGSVGRSIPQALFEAGRRAPAELHRAFEAAHREWLITTDFARTTAVLKRRLADPTADAACETLLVAHEVGGADLDRRLEALVEDRIMDLHGRRDARAKQAGARFARWFVLVVPLGMALAGMGVGDGREAYRSSAGQAIVAVAMLLVVVCWFWAGRIMALPTEDRVFER